MLRKYLKNRHLLIGSIIVFVLLLIKISCYDIAYAWSIPDDYGESSLDIESLQQSIIECNLGEYVAYDYSYGATGGEFVEFDKWHVQDTTTRYALFYVTIRLEDAVYDSALRGNDVRILANTSAEFKCEDQLYDTDIMMTSFVSSGDIVNSGLDIDDFIDTSSQMGSEERVISRNYTLKKSSIASLTLSITDNQYIRFGMISSIQSSDEMSKGQINNISLSVSILVEDYFVGNISYNTIENNQPNVYSRNIGDLYGTSVEAITNSTEYGLMQDSRIGGSSQGLLQPEYETILSQAGEAPQINDINICAGNYNDGYFGPNNPISFLPEMSFNSVLELEHPTIIALEEALPVGDINIDKDIPEPFLADTLDYKPIIMVNTFYAKEPADAYEWKNPTELDPKLNNRVDYTYKTSSGEFWTYTKHFYDIKSSGTIDFNIKHKLDGWADEVQIKFHTYDKDMHIVLAEGIDLMWGNDKDSKMEIIGTGKVFIYLLGNNHIFFDADYWTTDANYLGTSEREEFTRLFFIGIGGSNTMQLLKINARVAVYMPHGRSAEYNAGPNRIEFVSNTDMHEINGIVVADEIVFGIEESGKFTFYRNYDSATNKYLSGLPMIIYFNGYDRNLNYFLSMPLSVTAFPNYNWRSDRQYYE